MGRVELLEYELLYVLSLASKLVFSALRVLGSSKARGV